MSWPTSTRRPPRAFVRLVRGPRAGWTSVPSGRTLDAEGRVATDRPRRSGRREAVDERVEEQLETAEPDHAGLGSGPMTDVLPAARFPFGPTRRRGGAVGAVAIPIGSVVAAAAVAWVLPHGRP